MVVFYRTIAVGFFILPIFKRISKEYRKSSKDYQKNGKRLQINPCIYLEYMILYNQR
nr:MAG TPA: hypothetical protein [Caudoviricetes sp.]